MKKLSDTQIEAFDTEYVDEDRWTLIKGRIDADFPDGDFSFLDLGGGSGRFADRLLSNYPRAVGSVLDNSEVLLGRNQQNAFQRMRAGAGEWEFTRGWVRKTAGGPEHDLDAAGLRQSRGPEKTVRNLLSARGLRNG